LIARLLRVYSYLFHLGLSIFLMGMAIVAMLSSNRLRLEMLPWQGDDLAQWLLWGNAAGILSIILAVTGIFRYLFPLWTMIVLVVMVRGYLLQPYSFGGRDQFYSTLWLIGGAFVAFLASLTLFGRKKRRATY
jgi:hypothetical protein